MVLWQRRTTTSVIYCISSVIRTAGLPLHKTGMTSNSLLTSASSLSSPVRGLQTSPKRKCPLGDNYEELNELLSDSDGWEDELPVEPVQATNQKQVKVSNGLSKRIGSEFSDADDSLIYEFFQSEKNNANMVKNLAGASTKSSRKLPARGSFSSFMSEELRKPLVESTQQGNLYSSEDSRLLLSLLRGDNSHRQEHDNSHQISGQIAGPMTDGTKQKTEITQKVKTASCQTAQETEVTIKPKIESDRSNPAIEPEMKRDRIEKKLIHETKDPSLAAKKVAGKFAVEKMLSGAIAEGSQVAVPITTKSEKDMSFEMIEGADFAVPDRNSTNETEPKPSNIAPKKEDSRNSHQDSRSFEMIEEQKSVRYADKFTLLTQRQCIQSTQEIESRLKLNPKAKVIIPVRLSKEQEDVIRLAKAGHNIFYTGSAGTGKSVLLREMIKVLKDVYGHEQVAVTASTGLAACNIGGVTLHSFAGVGLGGGEVTKLYRKVRRSRKHVKRWETVSALVIDEVSMLDGELLDKLDFIAQKIRKNSRPFGDIQLVFCGDFFQLPPVTKDPNNSTKFAFESNVWKEGIDTTIMLTKVFRQQGDSKFIEMLNKMRLGKIDAETEREFKSLSRPLPQDEIIPAELYSTRNEVERANNQRLNKLPGKAHIFHAIDGGVLEDREMKDRLLQNFLAPKELQLKIGAQVMMIKNIDATLVNGSLGKVIDFIDPETYMFYETIVRNPDLTPEALAKVKDNPDLLRETWNQLCEEGENDTPVRQKSVKDAFCRGDPDESVDQLGESIFDFLKDVTSDDIETKTNLNRKRELLRQVHESSKAKKKLPLVRFKTSDLSTRTILVEPESWAIEDENEKPLVSRVQLPLMLAWSLSIHKSQGQTLPKVKVDLRRVFEKGQAYVALSRAVSREGLQVLNFDKSRIQAHQKVVDFYSTLVTVKHAIKQLQAKAELTTLNKKRKIETTPFTTSGVRRTRQSRSRSKTPTNTTNSANGIATMLMNRVQRNSLPGRQAVISGECADTLKDPGTSAYTHEA